MSYTIEKDGRTFTTIHNYHQGTISVHEVVETSDGGTKRKRIGSLSAAFGHSTTVEDVVDDYLEEEES